MADAVGRFEDIVALVPGHAPILLAIRALVTALHPGCVEVARPGDRAVSWGWGARKRSEAYACAIPYRAHVNLGFYRGALLPDPARRLSGTGLAMRHVRLRDAGEVDDAAIRALLVAARDERWAALPPPAGGGGAAFSPG